MRLQLPVPCFCRAPLAKKSAGVHPPSQESQNQRHKFHLVLLDRVSICTKQAVHPSIRCCLSRCLASTYACMLPTQAPCMHIYIYIWKNFRTSIYTHTSNPSMHYGRNSRPWLQPTYCFPALQACFAIRPLCSYCNICKPSSK